MHLENPLQWVEGSVFFSAGGGGGMGGGGSGGSGGSGSIISTLGFSRSSLSPPLSLCPSV